MTRAPEARRLPVLLITRNLPPLLGGMERLNHRIARILSCKGPLAVVGPSGSAASLGPQCLVQEVSVRPIGRFLLGALLASIRMARRTSPEIVLAGSGLTAPLAWVAARVARSRFVVYLHGLDVVVANPFYQACWLPFVRRADLCFANSENTRRLAMLRGVGGDRIKVLHPGTDLHGFVEADRAAFRAGLGLDTDQPVLLSVGRLTARKGVPEFVKLALPGILASHPDAVLLVLGADASDALQRSSGSGRAQLMEIAEKAGVGHAVRLLPPCNDRDLTLAYRGSDVHVFPVLDLPGDVEGFGMVAVEAAAHGLPTVAFAVGGVPDAIVADVTGSLVDAGDYAGIGTEVLRWLDRDRQPGTKSRCIEAAGKFGWDVFAEGLEKSLSSLAGKPPG